VQKKLRIGIIGSGNIGTDLLMKVIRSDYLDCKMFIGRNLNSKGMSKALTLNVPLSDKGIDAIIDNHKEFDLIFDSTTSASHLIHAPIFEKFGLKTIDMTPAKIGKLIVPAVNIDDVKFNNNINMITCGGQSSIPIAHAISNVLEYIEYIEIVSTISSKSAGPGTRANIDEYIETTEKALGIFTGCKNIKVIINLNPAIPSIDMQTTIYIKTKDPNLNIVNKVVFDMIDRIKEYVPGYDIVMNPIYSNDVIMLTIKVQGVGDYLPKYAGNLDIINCAAISVAEKIAKNLNGIKE